MGLLNAKSLTIPKWECVNQSPRTVLKLRIIGSLSNAPKAKKPLINERTKLNSNSNIIQQWEIYY